MCNVNKPSVPRQATAARMLRACAARRRKPPICRICWWRRCRLSAWALQARSLGIVDHQIDSFAPRAFFSTLTNVNFDSQRIIGYARETLLLRDSLAARCRLLDAGVRVEHPMAALQLAGDDMPALLQQAAQFALNSDKAEVGDDVHGLRMLCLYGLKGAAAYMEHAHVLGQFDEQLYADYHAFMAWLGTRPRDVDTLLNNAMGIGKMNFNVMAILDRGETQAYGDPRPSAVNVRPVAGKAILISGHDLKDLRMLLEQTEGQNVNVYTHGEMLPAHGYPELKNSSIWWATTAAAGRTSRRNSPNSPARS